MDTNGQLAALVGQAFTNQSALNDRLRPDWKEQGWRYYRAIWTEMAEGIMHTNWAWWKTAEVDAPLTDDQRLDLWVEMCDVLHFGLSLDIIHSAQPSGRTIEYRTGDYLYAFGDARTSTETVDEAIEAVVVDTILLRDFNVKKFAKACNACGLTLPGLLAFYFAKSALNAFRWANGYKEKKYTKMWPDGAGKTVEDNVIMARLVQSFLANRADDDVIAELFSEKFQNAIYDKLSVYYEGMNKPTAVA